MCTIDFCRSHSVALCCCSLAAYLWFLLRRWRWRRSQVGPVSDFVREYLIGVSRPERKPVAVAVAHARDAYLNGTMTGRKGDPVVWEAVANALNKDTRIEKSKHLFGNAERASWTWVAALPQ